MKSASPWLAAVCCAATLLACAGPSASSAPEPSAVAPPGPPPSGPPPPLPGAGLPDGEWVFTQQYGWIWMTYDDRYTYLPPGGSGQPLEFVFYGSYGWTWIAAPWVWGYGPRPYWGRARPDRFGWYRHGYWRSPQRWRYTGSPTRGEVARQGVRPPPERGDHRAGPPAPPPPPSRVQGRGGGRERAGREGNDRGRREGDAPAGGDRSAPAGGERGGRGAR